MAVSKNNLNIVYLKSKFFIYRLVSYFSFLLIPVWVQKSIHLNHAFLYLMMTLYIMFMIGQWFMLGKEIDHFLNISFQVNSSIDRIIYRLFLGMIFFIVYFYLLGLLPNKWIYNGFWITWVVLGIFYSWPTRGKIIKESVSTNFNEFRYLDSFEKTLVGMAVIMYLFSIPELSTLTNIEALKLFWDPLEKINPLFWNFLTVNYYPFKNYPLLFRIGWSLHFYFIGTGLFLLTFYALLRFFTSRRLSLLGVFSLLSSWSFSKILANNLGDAITTTYSLLWIWTTLWIIKSSTYKSGLFLALVGYLGVIINQTFFSLVLIQFYLLYFYYLKDQTLWFKKQMMKYASLGCVFILFILFFNIKNFEVFHPLDKIFFNNIADIISSKGFFSLSIFGFLILSLKLLSPKLFLIRNVHFDIFRIKVFLTLILIIFLYCMLFDDYLIKSFALMWPIAFLSLIPLELLFQSISKFRSGRNMIFVVYILICLLDSHFEGRVKIFLRLFN
ncbi:MAG: hypothetical protein OXB84_05505 [Halobacteriovoraceae bacterium]|nr:hypothetical protein [Halobacteriovoraceae bacterium]